MTPIPMQTQVLTVRNMADESIAAPLGVWLGALIQALPPVMREEVITLASSYMAQVAQMGQPSRIVIPS